MARFVSAYESADLGALVALLTGDVLISITCSGNKCPFAIVFDTSRFQAILNLPAIEVDERSLPLAGVAVMIPLLVMVRPWRRRVVR